MKNIRRWKIWSILTQDRKKWASKDWEGTARKVGGKPPVISHKPKNENVSKMKEWQPVSNVIEEPSNGRTRKCLSDVLAKQI